MADENLVQLRASKPFVSPLDPDDLFFLDQDTGTTPESRAMTAQELADELTSVFGLGGGGGAKREGLLNNGKIVKSISANDLIVSIKTIAGADPSAGDPVTVVLGGVEYSITAALSVTISDGTNTFGAGSASHLGQTLFLPVHLGVRLAGPTVFIAVSRCFGNLYSDFSTTATDEDYLSYSGSAPASTDPVVNIGYVSASNSGSASYNWSAGSPDVAHSIPISETPIMTFAPQQGGFSAVPTQNYARYLLTKSRKVSWVCRSGANGTSNATTFTIDLPFRARTITDGSWQVLCNVLDNSVSLTAAGRCAFTSGATQASVFKDAAAGAFTASGGKRVGGMQWNEYEY